MRLNFYCGNTPPGGAECGTDWFENSDEVDNQPGFTGETFHATCPTCGAIAHKFVPDHPDSP